MFMHTNIATAISGLRPAPAARCINMRQDTALSTLLSRACDAVKRRARRLRFYGIAERYKSRQNRFSVTADVTDCRVDKRIMREVQTCQPAAQQAEVHQC
jgi:hypothetical protein